MMSSVLLRKYLDIISESAQAPAGVPYIIKPGDNLTKIARANGTTIKDIMAANPQIKDPNKIYAGAQLNLPNATAPAATPAQAPAATPAQAPATPAATPPTAAAPAATPAQAAATPPTAAAPAQPAGAQQQSSSSWQGTVSGITANDIRNHPQYQAEYQRQLQFGPKDAIGQRMARQATDLKIRALIAKEKGGSTQGNAQAAGAPAQDDSMFEAIKKIRKLAGLI